MTPELILGSMAGLVGSAVFAFSVVVYRSQSKEIRPLAISSIKMWVALPVMAFALLLPFAGNPLTVPLHTMFLLAISILFGAVIGDTIYLISQERIGVSYAFPVAMSFPIMTFAFTIFFLGEPLIVTRLVGAVIAVVGIVILSNEQSKENSSSEESGISDVIGIGLALLTALLYAAGTTILQVGLSDIDPFAGNFLRVAFGSIAFVPMFAVARYRGMPRPTMRATKVVAIAGFFGMGIGSLLYVTAVKYAGAAITSVLASTAPLWAVPVSVFFLKERLTRMSVVGILATVVGVFLVIMGF
ncbi:MAG: DMT family transporter [Candidatus Thorarchaeota archaeon]|nr:MAG: DMT family transporter [Candidatus Thorarchaeota archaeon]